MGGSCGAPHTESPATAGVGQQIDNSVAAANEKGRQPRDHRAEIELGSAEVRASPVDADVILLSVHNATNASLERIFPVNGETLALMPNKDLRRHLHCEVESG
jgi:hypothetical protein